ncbi:MAG: hypothetical protein IKS71_05990 [Bacteroidales bacterium]|nr:hypothetical protein [Bacteroidales bacterium]
MKKSFAEILAAELAEANRRVLAKVPEWKCLEWVEIPDMLSAEQCSSSATAFYKAGLLKGCRTIADLTGGLGVDSWAFSQIAEKVWYNEVKNSLLEATEKNFKALGVTNVIFSLQYANDRIKSLPEVDAIYLDPARRDNVGKKVFLVEDCQPDVLKLLPELFKKAPKVLVKLSPMADLTMLRERFGARLRELHVVSLKGEVKELLLMLTREDNPQTRIIATNLKDSLAFLPEEERDATAVYPLDLNGLQYLFEPDPALTKAGAFKLICSRFGLTKLALSTHVYLSEKPSPFGKNYQILDVFDWGNTGFKECAEKYPLAEVSARNVPMSSDELKARLGVRPSADTHIFGVTVDIQIGPARKLIVARREIETKG